MAARRWKLVGVVGAATAMGLVGAAPAGAAPKKGPTFEVTCPGLGTFDVVTPPGNGAFTPAFIVGTTQVFIPHEVAGTVTVDGEVVEEFDDVKRAPLPSNAITCTFAAAFEEDGAEIEVSGTAVGVIRGG
jgi:hypothetical protein